MMKAVAYYNLGVEYEHMTNLNEAITYLNKAQTIGRYQIGKNNDLTKKIEKCRAKLIQKRQLN